jgi:hypothetical protein
MTVEARQVLVPFDPREAMEVSAAARFVNKSNGTIRGWCENYALGRKIGGVWHVSRVALLMFLDGDTAALVAYHGGAAASNEAVMRYYARAGLSAQSAQSAQIAQSHQCQHSRPTDAVRLVTTSRALNG